MRFAVLLFLVITVFLQQCGKTETKRVVVRDPAIPPPGPVPPAPPPVQPTPDFVSFDAFESEVLADLTGLPTAQQLNARYLTICDQLNAGQLTDEHRRGVEKSVNLLSTEIEVEPGQWIGQSKCTLRIDLRDYGLDGTKWRIIEGADPLRFESFTDRGILIKQLTQTRRPWIHGTNFTETAHNNDTYYNVLEIPSNLKMFLKNFSGCNIQRDFDDFNEDLYMVGLRRSLIALQKNRSILLTQCKDGAFSATYDTIREDITSGGRNLSINPFPIEARTDNTFQHDAQEFIGTLPNGLFFYALFNNQGVRETFAPTNIVVDNVRPRIDPVIRNSRSCSSCHARGFIEVTDFIANHVNGNPNFNAIEIQKAQAYFGRQQAMLASMRQANDRFGVALAKLGIDGSNDPLNELTDTIREEMTAKQIAGFLFLEESEFLRLLPQSPRATLAIGQLLNGQTINFQDLIQVSAILVEDLNLFQEGLGQ